MQDWSKKRNEKIFALNPCMDVVVAGKTGKDSRENCGTELLRSRVNRNKNRYAIVPFPCEQSIFAFQKLERRWNGTIAFPCERGLRFSYLSLRCGHGVVIVFCFSWHRRCSLYNLDFKKIDQFIMLL